MSSWRWPHWGHDGLPYIILLLDFSTDLHFFWLRMCFTLYPCDVYLMLKETELCILCWLLVISNVFIFLLWKVFPMRVSASFAKCSMLIHLRTVECTYILYTAISTLKSWLNLSPRGYGRKGHCCPFWARNGAYWNSFDTALVWGDRESYPRLPTLEVDAIALHLGRCSFEQNLAHFYISENQIALNQAIYLDLTYPNLQITCKNGLPFEMYSCV